jgi:hypothetical protein
MSVLVGEDDYDWAWITITSPAGGAAGCHGLLIRRRISDGELAFYRCWTPQPVPLRALGPGERYPLDRRDVLPDRQEHRPGPTAGAPLGFVVPAHHAGHARPRHPHRYRRPRTRPSHRPNPDSVDVQRNPVTLRPDSHQHHPHHRPLAALVNLAPPTPSQRQDQPLPPPRPAHPSTSIYITNPGCRTSLTSRAGRVGWRAATSTDRIRSGPAIPGTRSRSANGTL